MALRGITFDLWDTIVVDDSDEPKRSARGLRSKPAERRHLLWQALQAEAPTDKAAVDLAYDVADAAFRLAWHGYATTWPVAQRLQVALDGLGRDLPAERFAAVVTAHEEMELDIPPDPVPGMADVLAALAGRYRLCIVSDAIVSPGRCLRRLLAQHDLARHFTGFVFSDEVGRAKPHRAMFDAAAAALDCKLGEMLHVGDRDSNDVQGPQALGMKAVLFTAVRDRGADRTKADAVCGAAADLPAVIDGIAAA